MAGYRRQCLAARGCNIRRPAKHSRTDGPLRRHRQEEMGDQLRLHVDLRLCFGPRRLGSLRLQYGVRAAMVSVPWHAEPGDVGPLHDGTGDNSGGGVRHAAARLSDGDAHLLPVRVRRHHRHHSCRLCSWPHELLGLDDLLPGMDDAGLYGRGVQPLGRRLARGPRRGGLLRRLCHPSRRRNFGVRRRLGCRTTAPGRSRPFPAEQPADHAGRRRHPVAGLERLQRRRPLLRQRRCGRGRAQHQHRDRSRPAGLDGDGQDGLRQAVGARRGQRHDRGPGGDHPRRRLRGWLGRDHHRRLSPASFRG